MISQNLLRLFGIGVALQLTALVPTKAANLKAEELYKVTNVWTVHLKFAPEQFEAMEPKGGFGPFGGMRGGGPGPGGPRPGPGPGGPGEFGLTFLLTQTFASEGDLNKDGRFSRDEFGKLAAKWSKEWDTKSVGKLGADDVRKGLNSAGRPPGAPAGGMPGGMTLQGTEGKRNGLASAMGIEFNYVHADLDFEGQQLSDVGVRYKGNGTFMESRGSLKRSLKVDLDQYKKDQKLGDISTLTLQNNVTDGSYMNEVLAYRLYRDAGVPAPRTAYAKVFVTAPGKHERKYFGLYSLSETVDKNFVKDHFTAKGGALFKPVTPALFSYLGSDWKSYNQTYDPKTSLSDEQKKRVMDLCKLVSEADDGAFQEQIGTFIDLPEFARYMAVTVWLSDLDGILGPGQNFYVYLNPKTKLFEFIPWDQDHSFGQFDRASQEQRDNLSIHRPWQNQNRFLERMFKVESFKKLYVERLDEFSKTIFEPSRLAKQVDEVAAVIRPAVKEESETKLEKFDKVVAGEIVAGGGFGPFGGSRIKPIKPFAEVRTKSVIEQVSGRSEGMTPGGFGFPGGGGPRGGGPGGLAGFGPVTLFADPLFKALDEDKDASVSSDEFTKGFNKLFDSWNGDQSGFLTQEQLRAGIEKDLSPMRGGFPGFGPPPGQRFPGPNRNE